jgi:hypothetical protein
MASPILEHGPTGFSGATSGFTQPQAPPKEYVQEDPSQELDRELAGAQHGGVRR